jgi:Holliday junction resolvase
MARRDQHVFAFEVKNARFYAYFPRKQIEKLFRFLDGLIPTARAYKHAIIAAHLGKKWIFREIKWETWEANRLPVTDRITKRDKGNFNPEKASMLTSIKWDRAA